MYTAKTDGNISCSVVWWVDDVSSVGNVVLSYKPRDVIDVNGQSYRLEKYLGKGSFGVTYKAKDVITNKQYALKLNFPFARTLAERAVTVEGQSVSVTYHRSYSPAVLDTIRRRRETERDMINAFYDEAKAEMAVAEGGYQVTLKMPYCGEKNFNTVFMESTISSSKPSTEIQRRDKNRSFFRDTEMELAYKAAGLVPKILNNLIRLLERKLFHLDIKFGNFVLSDLEDMVSLVDFGGAFSLEMGRVFNRTATQKLTTAECRLASVIYGPVLLKPELKTKERFRYHSNHQNYTHATDINAVGLLILTMFGFDAYIEYYKKLKIEKQKTRRPRDYDGKNAMRTESLHLMQVDINHFIDYQVARLLGTFYDGEGIRTICDLLKRMIITDPEASTLTYPSADELKAAVEKMTASTKKTDASSVVSSVSVSPAVTSVFRNPAQVPLLEIAPEPKTKGCLESCRIM